MPSCKTMSELLLAGASVRAAAQSASRAGFRVIAVDLFADADLRAVAETIPVRSVAGELGRIASQVSADGWMYTGALENAPAVVDRVSQRHRLCGNAGNTLRAVRDPSRLAAALATAGLYYPDVRRGTMRPTCGSWLSKPLRSCGGNGVYLLDDQMLADKTPTESRRCRYWQRRIEGSVCSAVFVAAGGKARILGVSRQLVGLDWCGAADFQYAGNIGPITLGEGLLQQLRSIGECLARCFPLCGLFGVDVVVDAQRVWTIEVNPRYCASVEIFERGLDTNFVRVHLAACLQGELPACPQPMPSRLHGKAVLYARRDSTLTASRLARLTEEITEPGGLVCLADLPSGPTRLRTGQPVLTVLAQGQDEPEVLTGLQKIAQRIYGILCGQSKF